MGSKTGLARQRNKSSTGSNRLHKKDTECLSKLWMEGQVAKPHNMPLGPLMDASFQEVRREYSGIDGRPANRT